MGKKILRGLLFGLICSVVITSIIVIKPCEDPPFGQKTPDSITRNI